VLNNAGNGFLFGVHCIEEGLRPHSRAAGLCTGVETDCFSVILPWTSSTAMSPPVPAVSMAMG